MLENKGLGMCVGESERQQWGMLQRSFPGKWPAKDSEDEFCADMGRGAAAICGQEDLAFYSEVGGNGSRRQSTSSIYSEEWKQWVRRGGGDH